VPVETKNDYHLWKGYDAVDATITATDTSGHNLGTWYSMGDQLYTKPRRPGDPEPPIRLTITRERDLFSEGWDIGTWGSYWSGRNDSRDSRFQVGIRISPLRILYDTIAFDAVVSKDAVGAGLSFYLPSDHVDPWWRHWGLGAWWLAPTSGAAPGWAVGLSFSTHP